MYIAVLHESTSDDYSTSVEWEVMYTTLQSMHPKNLCEFVKMDVSINLCDFYPCLLVFLYCSIILWCEEVMYTTTCSGIHNFPLYRGTICTSRGEANVLQNLLIILFHSAL